MSRKTVAYLSVENLLHNLSVIKKHSHNAKIIAMVKANAYGHGIRSVAKNIDGKVDILGVASIDEAMILKDIGIKTEIILMEGVFEKEEINLASKQKLHVIFHSEHQIKWLSEYDSDITKNIIAWLKINTGMNRLGFEKEKAIEIYKYLANNNIVKQINIMSHFASSEDIRNPTNKKQIDLFESIKREIISLSNGLNYQPEFSLANSAAIFNFSNSHYDYVRPGIALYGISPLKNISAQDLGLKPVMTMQSNIIAIRDIKKGDYVGYGGKYQADKDMKIAVVPCGYGDGYPVTAINGTPILVGNKKCQIVGRVSMDMLTIDLSNNLDAKINEIVTLWGDGLPVEEVAEYINTIPYYLITEVQNRVKFLWEYPKNSYTT